MAFKDKLIWLKGKKIAVCEPDETRFAEIKLFLEHYHIEVTGLNSAEAMSADLQQRRYATHRVFFAVFINYELAEQMEPAWREVTTVNPKLLKTPMVLMVSETQLKDGQALIDTGYFRYTLTYPISASDLLRVLRRLNRWNAIRGDISPTATLDKP